MLPGRVRFVVRAATALLHVSITVPGTRTGSYTTELVRMKPVIYLNFLYRYRYPVPGDLFVKEILLYGRPVIHRTFACLLAEFHRLPSRRPVTAGRAVL